MPCSTSLFIDRNAHDIYHSFVIGSNARAGKRCFNTQQCSCHAAHCFRQAGQENESREDSSEDADDAARGILLHAQDMDPTNRSDGAQDTPQVIFTVPACLEIVRTLHHARHGVRSTLTRMLGLNIMNAACGCQVENEIKFVGVRVFDGKCLLVCDGMHSTLPRISGLDFL